MEINGKLNEKWIWNLMDEQTDFIMEMKMGTLIGNEFGKRFDYNEKTSLIFNNEHTKQSIK